MYFVVALVANRDDVVNQFARDWHYDRWDQSTFALTDATPTKAGIKKRLKIMLSHYFASCGRVTRTAASPRGPYKETANDCTCCQYYEYHDNF
jgi:hypothetical protein